MNVVFTGPGRVGGVHVPRRVLELTAYKRGIQVSSFVHGFTNYIVSDKPLGQCTSNKARAALAMGVPRITADQFIEQIGGTVEWPAEDILTA